MRYIIVLCVVLLTLVLKWGREKLEDKMGELLK